MVLQLEESKPYMTGKLRRLGEGTMSTCPDEDPESGTIPRIALPTLGNN
jgi:hypothetical protein